MTVTLKLEGELDHHNAERVRVELDRKILSSGADTVIFDMQGLRFMDSSGIGVLLGRYKLFATRRLYIINADETVDRLLKMSGIYTVIPKYEGGVAV